MLKMRIDFKSLIQKKPNKINDDFLVCLITGTQGSGKSYFAIYHNENFDTDKTIYTNIKSYKSKKHKVIYFDKIEEIYTNNATHCIFIIDELSKKYTKDSKQDKAFYSWLQQSRKHNRYVYLITQEYLQVPTWLRGVADKVYTTTKMPFGLCKTSLGFPVLDKETMEWGIDTIGFVIYKRTKKITELYNTFEFVDEL